MTTATQNVPQLTEEYCLKEFGWTRSQFDIIKRSYFNNISDDEIKVFAHVCKHTKLDPILKQIYPVMRQGKMTIQTAIDGYRTIAERTGRYSPGREPTFVYDKNGMPLSATAYVKKMTTDGTWHEVAATAFFSEYNPGVGPFWKKMPHTMIAKCAEALALRKAFPAELSAVYTKDEMDQADHQQPDKLPEAECEDLTQPQAPIVPEIVAMPFDQVTEIMMGVAKMDVDSVRKCKEFINKQWGVNEFEHLPPEAYEPMINAITMNLQRSKKLEVAACQS